MFSLTSTLLCSFSSVLSTKVLLEVNNLHDALINMQNIVKALPIMLLLAAEGWIQNDVTG